MAGSWLAAAQQCQGAWRPPCQPGAAGQPLKTPRALPAHRPARSDWNSRHNITPAFIAAYEATYLQLIANVTALPGVGRSLPIFAAVGAIDDLYGPAVQTVVSAATAQGYSVTYAPVMGCGDGGNGQCGGCNGHPDRFQHANMTSLAAPVIARVTGWAWNATAAAAGLDG